MLPLVARLSVIENNWNLACNCYTERDYKRTYELFKSIEEIFITTRRPPPLVLVNNILCLDKILNITKDHSKLNANAYELSKTAGNSHRTWQTPSFSILRQQNLKCLPIIIANCNTICTRDHPRDVDLTIIPYLGVTMQYACGFLS